MLVSNLLFTMELYETMRAFNGKWVLMPWHQRRVDESVKHFALPALDLNHAIENVFVNSKKGDFAENLRIRLTYGEKYSDVVFEALSEWDGDVVSSQFWKVKTIQHQRNNPHFKLNNRQILDSLSNSALQEGYNEVLLCDEEGRFGEGSRTNILAVFPAPAGSGALFEVWTPMEGVLPGVLRSYLMENFSKEILWKNYHFHQDDLQKFPLFFASNAVRGLHPFEGGDGALLRDFAQLVNPVFARDWESAPFSPHVR